MNTLINTYLIIGALFTAYQGRLIMKSPELKPRDWDEWFMFLVWETMSFFAWPLVFGFDLYMSIVTRKEKNNDE